MSVSITRDNREGKLSQKCVKVSKSRQAADRNKVLLE